jgi:hypothetical protein
VIIAKLVFTIVRILMRSVEDFEVSDALILLIMLLPVYMFSFAVTFNISKW